MARKRGAREGEGAFPEPDLLPLMNIILMLILALITMAAMLPLGFLSSDTQKLSSGAGGAAKPKEEEKPLLNLIVFITEEGFNISVKGTVKTGELPDPKDPKKKMPLIPNVVDKAGDSVPDYAALQIKLEEIKALDKEEQRMTITAAETIKFDVIVQTMDAARFTREKTVLFPLVSFAAGIVG